MSLLFAIVPVVISPSTISPVERRPAAEFFTTPAVANGVMTGATAKVAVPVCVRVPERVVLPENVLLPANV